MKYSDMVDAMKEAEKSLEQADLFANKMAYLLIGRLNHVSKDRLIKLKKELKSFNATTGEWK